MLKLPMLTVTNRNSHLSAIVNNAAKGFRNCRCTGAKPFLVWNVIELCQQASAHEDLQETVSRMTVDLRLTTAARTFERAECTKSITQHREMIADLARRCRPSEPASKPPPLPAPYPESPDPFAQPN